VPRLDAAFFRAAAFVERSENAFKDAVSRMRVAERLALRRRGKPRRYDIMPLQLFSARFVL
jgi:hypothetical protein